VGVVRPRRGLRIAVSARNQLRLWFAAGRFWERFRRGVFSDRRTRI